MFTAFGILLAGCSGTGHLTTTPERSDTSASSASTTATTTSAATSSTMAPVVLSSAIIPGPAGFVRSTDPQAPSGPMDAARFNALYNSTTAAEEMHFVGGQEVTYDAAASADIIHVLLFQFATADDAASFLSGIGYGSSRSRPDPGVPGGEIFDLNQANTSGGWAHIAHGSNGPYAYEISYLSANANPIALLPTLSREQYNRI
jgi:hypothetical protein